MAWGKRLYLQPLAFLGVLVQAECALAGWFGPSNYHECILSEMKGRSIYLMPEAEKVCDIKFPCPDVTYKAEFIAFVNDCHRSEVPVSHTLEDAYTFGSYGFSDYCADQAIRKFCPDR